MATTVQSSTGTTIPLTLTDEQKQFLYDQGYIILKGVIDKKITSAAKARIKLASENQKKGGRREDLGSTEEMTNLVNASAITPILNSLIGKFDPPKNGQVGVIGKRTFESATEFDAMGYRRNDLPYYGSQTHMDGVATIYSRIPQDPKEVEGMTDDEKYNHYIQNDSPNVHRRFRNKGKVPDMAAKDGKPIPGKSSLIVGENGGVPLFVDPDCTLGIGSFTAFVIVPLNNQMRPGCGQTAVLPTAHHAAEKFYQWQYAQGGIMGPEGPGWKRINTKAANGLGLNYLPKAILEEFTNEEKYGPLESTSDGRKWPRTQQMLMEEGDVCITVYHMPHTGTQNYNGTESRKNIIFRIRAKAHNPLVIPTGVTDHPDRGQTGSFLDPTKPYHPYENPIDFEYLKSGKMKWFDQYERSKYLLCHPWEVWPGMKDIIAKNRGLKAKI